MIQIPELERYKKLHFAMIDIFNSTLAEYLEPTLQMIKNLIACEDAYVNVNHPDFIVAKDALLNLFKKDRNPPPEENVFEKPEDVNNIYKDSDGEGEESEEEEDEGVTRKNFFDNFMETNGVNKIDTSNKDSAYMKRINSTKVSNLPKDHQFTVGYEADNNMLSHISQVGLVNAPKIMRVDNEASARERIETKIIKNCVSSYFNIVRKHIADLVPKTIMAFLINKIKENSQPILYSALTDENDILDLMSEDPMIEEIRYECKSTIKNLERALILLNEARDFNYFKEIEKSGIFSTKATRGELEESKESDNE